MDDVSRDKLLPIGAPNPIIWCERCRRYHPQHTFTQADYDKVLSDGAKALADAIDAQAIKAFQQ